MLILTLTAFGTYFNVTGILQNEYVHFPASGTIWKLTP